MIMLKPKESADAYKYPVGAVVAYKCLNRFGIVKAEGRGVIVDRRRNTEDTELPVMYIVKSGYKGSLKAVGENEVTAVYDNVLALVLGDDD